MKKYLYQGKLIAKAGKQAELSQTLLKAAELVGTAEGSIMYAINYKADEPNAVYVIEIWETKEAHDNSLKIQAVKDLIMSAIPLLEEMPSKGLELELIGGLGV